MEREASSWPCPRCRLPLFRGTLRGSTLLGCGRCGGVWLDSEACQALIRGAAQDLTALAEQASRHASAAVDLGRADLTCPVCSQPMPRGQIPGTQVSLDVCAAHGTWFDANELRAIALTYAHLPAPAVFENPYPEESRPESSWWSDDDDRRGDDGRVFEAIMDWLTGVGTNDGNGGPPAS